MELQTAKEKAERLIAIHCPTYYFQFDNSKRRFGSCHTRLQRITLSRHLTLLNAEEEVTDTILHEIAHALTPRHHHDKVWKQACVKLGCRPIRCYTNDYVVPVKSKYNVVCPSCNYTMGMHRKRGDFACKFCCNKYSNGKYDGRFKLVWSEN